MTLLELLVKELPKRGGWPEDAHGAVQDKSGQIWFYKSGKPYCTGVIWGTDPISLDFEWVHWDLRLEMSEDYAKAIIAREQYKAAMAAQQPVWDGEGLPPVGVDCEWYDKNIKKWFPVKVVYSSEWVLVVRGAASNGDVVELGIERFVDADRCDIRPIRTEADRKRDEAIDALISLGVFTRPVAEKTVDAIAAGKITGVELTK